mmetsp:Transcript_12760/g.21546  ORF Transcript_12760/g.21546 Transcript_12760/m.21546 type:complete len:90 (+) Transcript_12760:507-776(+)
MQALQLTICQLIYSIHKKADPLQEANSKEVTKFCMEASPSLIFKSPDLYFIFEDGEAQKKNALKEEAKEQDGHSRIARNVERVEEERQN